jgi:TIR domain
MPHAFVSYVREDWDEVERLADALKAGGVDVWLDRERLLPGTRWQDAIRRAIREGSFFLACFSAGYEARESTYMNEELVIAIEELRKRPTERTWFVPVLLDRGTLPDRSIGAGESLQNFQYVDLHDAWNEGVRRLLLVMNPQPSRIERAVTMLRARPHNEQEDWVMWAWDYGSVEDQEVVRALKGYGEIDPAVEERGRSHRARDAEWVQSTLDRLGASHEAWLSLLERAETREKVYPDTLGEIESQALRLSRLGAIVWMPTDPSHTIFALTHRGRLLLERLRSDSE